MNRKKTHLSAEFVVYLSKMDQGPPGEDIVPPDQPPHPPVLQNETPNFLVNGLSHGKFVYYRPMIQHFQYLKHFKAVLRFNQPPTSTPLPSLIVAFAHIPHATSRSV